MSFVKQEPGLLSNPDGMRAISAMSHTNQQRPPHTSQPATTSTSVKDLIDQAIDEALTTRAGGSDGPKSGKFSTF